MVYVARNDHLWGITGSGTPTIHSQTQPEP